MNSITQKDVDRFWGKVDKEKSNIFYNGTRCWEWIAYRNSEGYGNIRLGSVDISHRVVWLLTYGKIPAGLCVLHHCDNTLCCNPLHLFLGTRKDNAVDRNSKNRQAKGEKHGRSKLSNKQVNEIRQRYSRYGKNGDDSSVLAKIFGVSSQQILSIVKNEFWRK